MITIILLLNSHMMHSDNIYIAYKGYLMLLSLMLLNIIYH